jgi:cysteinyl-tRNA synthetase
MSEKAKKGIGNPQIFINTCCELLGLDLTATNICQPLPSSAIKEIEELILERNFAKKEQNFNKADEIRAALLKRGIILEDNKTGTTWRYTHNIN